MDQAPVQSSVEDRMLAFVEREQPAQEEERPPESDAEAADQAEEAEQPEKEEQQQDEEERILKLKHDGQEIDKPESEVIALAQQGFDYTQKTQRLAEDRKAVEIQAQAIKAQETAFKQQVDIQNQLLQDIAKETSIDQQLSQYQSLDWQALSNSDPVEAQKLFFAYNQLQVQKGQVANERQRKQQELTQAQQTLRAKQIELGQQVLTKDIPGWGEELGKTLKSLGRDYGASDAELNALTEPWVIKALYDAQQWKKLQAEKPLVDKKVSTASPTVKPGAKNVKNAASATYKQNRDALRKTGRSDYAAKLIEQMI